MTLLSIVLQGKGTFARPFNSTQGFSAKGQLILFLLIIAVGLFIGFKVWRSLKKE